MPLDNELYFESIPSTNEYLKNNASKLNNLTYLRADYQTNGYGQFSRVWESKPKSNLLFSVLLKNININLIEKIKEEVNQTLINFLDKFKIKSKFVYPNDIHVKTKKILGILIETKVYNNNFEYVVIGVGLNVNQKSFNEPKATSMKLLTNKTYDLIDLYNTLIKDFNKVFNKIGVI